MVKAVEVNGYELKKFMEAVPRIEETVNTIFKRLFVEDPENSDKCPLVIEVRKNTNFRRQREEDDKTERRSKWRRRSFYLTLIGLVLTNLIILFKIFLFGG